ncbi:palmitoyltransferase for Vac8p [Trichoderma virens]|nr:palmitoyltransferase for Vac8p [Trichoderma virens]UKZ72745.1 palmitoyltransferase for Vac8p [Trichoderma virens FT-333]
MEDESSSDNPSMAFRWARRFERACCTTAKYFPLAFVYGLTSWACWVVVSIGRESDGTRWIGSTSSFFGVVLYLLLNWSYTTAVFTDPGSTTNDDGYGLLPTSGGGQSRVATSFTVKSNGEIRFCKKCQARKPDRTHHCSTCRRCVLKMDHHCPWLASCLGLRNYKPFILFLVYTTIFSFYAFAVSGTWFWTEVMDDTKYLDTLLPINFIMLAVMSGIIGLVVGAFTTWHIMLACRNQTTIECLEKTRYLTTVKKTLHQAQSLANGFPQARQFVDFHASALPGITTREEGEERRSQEPMPRVQMSYEEMERYQSRKRYEEYLDEQDSEKLPNAFDLGWKRNLLHLLGPSPLLWFLPICNTTGDGWSWEANPKWISERERLRNEREEQRQREVNAGWGYGEDIPSATADVTGNYHGRGPLNPVNGGARRAPSKADRILGRDPNLYADASQDVPMRRLSPRGRAAPPEDDLLDTDDEEQSKLSPGNGPQTAASRLEAERVAMSVVTNTRPWGRGGASGMLRHGSQQSSGSGNGSRMESPSSEVNDDGVD